MNSERRRILIASSFFFQAEDGIRDYKVTGVQTCALPISGHHAQHDARSAGTRPAHRRAVRRNDRRNVRSEERRVGKERKYQWKEHPYILELPRARRLK